MEDGKGNSNKDVGDKAKGGKFAKQLLKMQEKANKEIEKLLLGEKKKFERTIKLLLLGTGESGKSTIVKQMKIIHQNGFSTEEKKEYIPQIVSNILKNTMTLVEAANLHNWTINCQKEASEIAKYSKSTLTPEIAKAIKEVWTDQGIQTAYQNRNRFQLSDSAAYYFENLMRIAAPDYIPTKQDILRVRVQTTGVYEIQFVIDDVIFRMIDVGGQRSERRKWIHCFADVTAIIFCVGISEYDQMLAEDHETNRMHESLKVFEEISNNKWFNSTPIILFLNKKDLFEEKIARVDLKICFPEYTGGKNFHTALEYVANKFKSLNQVAKRPIYIHPTQATSTDNIVVVFSATKDIILRTVLRDVGIGI